MKLHYFELETYILNNIRCNHKNFFNYFFFLVVCASAFFVHYSSLTAWPGTEFFISRWNCKVVLALCLSEWRKTRNSQVSKRFCETRTLKKRTAGNMARGSGLPRLQLAGKRSPARPSLVLSSVTLVLANHKFDNTIRWCHRVMWLARHIAEPWAFAAREGLKRE